MRNAAKWTGMIAGFGLVIMSVGGAQAQQPGAEALESRAAAMFQHRADCGRVAGIYARAAALRTTADAQAVADLRLAGLLYAETGQMMRASAAMERAGEQALALGNFGAAAEAYTNAAFIVAQAGGQERSAMLAHRALWLADREGVSDGVRALVHHRLQPKMAAL